MKVKSYKRKQKELNAIVAKYLARFFFFVAKLPFSLLNFLLLVEQNNSEWPVSPVRPDGASGRARRQQHKIQAPRVLFSGQT
jgi:hypothetical protein